VVLVVWRPLLMETCTPRLPTEMPADGETVVRL
jgi:hypothetical protein